MKKSWNGQRNKGKSVFAYTDNCGFGVEDGVPTESYGQKVGKNRSKCGFGRTFLGERTGQKFIHRR